MHFKGFDDWIEIFRGGLQTDSAGTEHDGDALIDKALAAFNAAEHEPPVVIGHPADNAPAYGWVQALKRATKDGAAVLLAKFRDVVPEFADLAKRGLYKKRSAAFYPDGRLRHVGFLGAAPPAVKGLADIGFADANQISFEFSTKGDDKMTFNEFMEIFKFWKAVEKDPTLELPTAPAATAQPAKPEKTFTEADIEAARKEAAAAEREKADAEFAEKAQQAQRAARGEAIAAWCDKSLAEGKIAPAWIKSGIKQFCERMDAETELQFGEQADQKATPLAWFQKFIEELPRLVDFSEIAKRGKNMGAGDAAGKLDALVKQKMAADKEVSYSAAFAEAQAEHPDLARELSAEVEAVRTRSRQ